MNQDTRYATGYVTKGVGSVKDIDGSFIMSSDDIDRVGDIVEQDGWDLRTFKRNPVCLFSHDPEKIVGYWKNVRVEGNKLLGDLKLASTNLAQMVRQLISDGALRAVSVGFRVLDWESRDPEKDKYGHNGAIIKQAELLECSLCAVPAQANALLLSKKLGLSAQDRKLIFSPSQRERAPVVSDKSATVERARQDIAEMRALLKT